MYSAPAQEVNVPAITDNFYRTSTPISYAAVVDQQGKWRISFFQSSYLRRQNVFDVLAEAVEQLVETPDDWNSYDSPAPSTLAVSNAKPVLHALRTKLLQPERVVPSAEGGVAFTFVSGTASRAIIESLNDGETFALLYDLNGNAKTIEWPASDEAQLALVTELASHLRSEGLATKG